MPKKPKKAAAPAPVKDNLDDVSRRALKRVKQQAVVDSYRNSITKVGTLESKTTYGEYSENINLDPYTIEILLKDHDIARKICFKIVEDALRGGFGVKRRDSRPEEDKEDAAKILDSYKKLTAAPQDEDRVARGACWARGFGGGGVILGVRGAGALASPLVDSKAKALEYIEDFDRQDMTPVTWYPDGRVEKYRWQPAPSGAGTVRNAIVHESRVLVFPGAKTTNRGRSRNGGWDHSVLQACWDVLKSFDGMFGSVDSMFADVSQAVFKLQGLIQGLAEADGEAQADVQTRLQILDLYRSSQKAIMLDAGAEDGEGAEDFSVVERDLAGLDGPMQQYLIRLACAAEMPLTVLLGMAPAGMDATGESDMILYFNTVDVYRQKLTRHLLRLVRMIAMTELGASEEEANLWEIDWPELARPKPLDVATRDNMAVTSAIALVTGQVVLPEEVALCLDKIAPSLGLTIDAQARIKALKAALAEVEQRMMTGPQAPEPVEGPGGAPAEKKSERKTPSKAAKRQV